MIVEMGGEKVSARLANLARPGALIETSRPLPMGIALVLHCGTIVAAAVPVWTRENLIGLSFVNPLTDEQVQEQVSRSRALASRRPKLQVDRVGAPGSA